MPTTGSTEDLLSRLRYTINRGTKPIAFVAGSGLTRGTVPGVERLVRSMRSALQDENDAARFDREVDASDWGARYQQAADFLVRNRDQDLLNRLIRLAVLGACTSLSLARAPAARRGREQTARIGGRGIMVAGPRRSRPRRAVGRNADGRPRSCHYDQLRPSD